MLQCKSEYSIFGDSIKSSSPGMPRLCLIDLDTGSSLRYDSPNSDSHNESIKNHTFYVRKGPKI